MFQINTFLFKFGVRSYLLICLSYYIIWWTQIEKTEIKNKIYIVNLSADKLHDVKNIILSTFIQVYFNCFLKALN